MRHILKTFVLGASAGILFGCSEKVDESARYVFTDKTILGYLQSHDAYSEYADLLSKVDVSKISDSKISQLLDARGNYTVFAPTNEAIQTYLGTLVDEGLIESPSWDAFADEHKLDSIRKVVVYNSIIDGGDDLDSYYYIADFPEINNAEFPLANLNDKKLSVQYVTSYPDSVYINGSCAINSTERDILVTNGVIHQVESVIAPKDITASSYIQEYIDERLADESSDAGQTQDGFLTCFRIIQACGLMDTLSAIRDEVYEEKYQRGDIKDLQGMTSYGFAEGSIAYAPKHRLYGFTIFAETDDFWRSQNIDPKSPDLLEEVTQWILENNQYSSDDVFVTDDNYKSEDNLLYQWITYHMLPMRLAADKLVNHANEYGYNINNPYKYTIPVYEFYTSMGNRRLFKLHESAYSDGVYINRFPIVDNARRGTGLETGCDPDKVGAKVMKESDLAILNDMVNCCVYPIDAPISYNDDVRDNLQKNRIRFDGMSLFPEAMSNDIRLKHATEERYKHVYIPNTETEYDYFPNMKQSESMKFVYYNAWNDDWCNLHRDEMKGVGRYEVTFTLPPVPRKGTYEVRYKVLANGNRGIAQIYFGDDPNNLPVAGIPLDLTMTCSNSKTGWENDTEDDEYNAEIDKRMRNNGYMKGPQSIDSNDGTERGYNDRENIRHIFVRQTMDPNKTYYLKLKSVLDSDRKEFYMDFIEYCAKEVYDNPEEPEDIW